jgi:hypothetical protein
MTDPIDETARSTPDPEARPAPDPAAPPPPAGETPMPDRPDGDRPEPSLRADPDRPADSGWREPPWFPARRRRDRPSNGVAVVFGVILIAIGIWFFLKATLGIALPSIAWSSIWPVILIVIGAFLLLRSFGRRA